MKTIFINGKFCAQRTTGVQRLASGLVEALDAQLSALSTQSERWVLLCPPNASPPQLDHIAIRVVGPRTFGLHVWEQLVLPALTVGRPLLNLAGPAPVLKRNQVCLFADAAVFDRPDGYTRPFRIWYRFLFKRLARQVRLLLTISNYSSTRLAFWLAIPPENLRVVPCAASHIEQITPDGTVGQVLSLEGKPFLLAVGSANPTKNLPRLLRAFDAVNKPGVRLVVVGGANSAVFAGEAVALDNPGIVRAGALPDAQLKWLYENAIAFVFPSTYEGFGLPPLEAMSCGCPVVASNAAAIPEVCGDAALYFDPESEAEIAAAMQLIVDDDVLRNDLVTRGRRRASSFTWESAGARLLAHLQQAGIVRTHAK